ncbi:MAG: two-component regulator propeller domain-containing protein [Acidobacteriota bacterium]
MRYAIKHSITFTLALGLTLLISHTAITQNNTPSSNLHQWGAVTLFHGLPSDHVRAISQDADGVMWLGTDAGLVRYDGRRVQRISAEGPLANRIRAIKLDLDGALWIATDAGAARVIDDDIKLIPQTENKTVSSIIAPERGRAIFATEQGAIIDCSIKNGSFTARAITSEDHPALRIESLNRPLPLTAIIAKDDSIILGSRSRGLLSVQGERIDEIPLRPRPFFIEAIARDSAGRFFIGAQTSIDDSGLYQSADLRRASKIGAGLGTVTSIAFDDQQEMWVGTDQNGAFHFRGENLIERFTFNSTAGGLRSNHIYSTFVDREGVIWFGTDRGACRYDSRSPRSEIVSVEPESNFVRVLFQSSDGRLWCGANRGLFLREETGWRQVDELRGKTVYAISQDSEGRLIIGTASGLFTSDDGAQFSRLAEGEIIRALAQFQGATYIANFNRGLERLDRDERTLILPVRQIIGLHADKNQMWIGTANAGAMVFDGKQAVTPPELESLRDAAVRSIAVSRDGAVWFATSRGLYALRSLALTPVIEGIDARYVITTENNQAWCATEAGLYTALIDKDAGAVTSRMSAEQGLPSQNVFALMSESSALWIGTNRGAVRYTPNPFAPAIKAARLLGQRAYSLQEIAAGVRLEYPQNSLSVEVSAASSRTFPEQFQYRFSLISAGREVKSKLAREPSLSVENLRPGRYLIIARAITGDLVQSDPLSIAFEVESAPFPWTTAALSLLLVLALAAIGWGYYQNKRLTRTNEALEGANRQLADTRMQLASETEAERRRIARDLHDQTLADLRRLLLLADELPRKDGGESLIDPLVLRREIESISTEIRRICEDLSPSALENVGLAAALEYALSEAVAHLPAERRFEYEFSCREGIEERLSLSPVVQIQIYRIAQEAISNISRHAGAKRVRLSVEERNGGFLLTLEDDGCGFDPRSKRTGRGIANIISRASLIEAEAEWTELEGGGTRFILRKGIKAD